GGTRHRRGRRQESEESPGITGAGRETMSVLSVTCPHCRALVQTQASAGQTVRCPSCGQPFPVTPTPPEPGWFLVRDKTRVGPLPRSHLEQLATAGQLAPADMVLQEGTHTWVPARSVAGLFVAVAVPAATPTTPPATGLRPLAPETAADSQRTASYAAAA